MPYLSKNYKRYDLGTSQLATSADPTSGSLLGITRAIGSGIDSIQGNDINRSPGLSAASGALQGAGMGSMFGPIGTGVGAAVGAGVGLFTGMARRKAAQRAWQDQQAVAAANQRSRSQAVLANDPELATGVAGAGYFAGGGFLSRNYLARTQQAEGGSLTPMNSDAVEVNGPSHEEGGVQLPNSDAEVEGGETMAGNFVFSERLGFAQEHKRIARAIGKIEDKGAMTPERVNSVKRLREREQSLALSQEYLKQTMQHFGQPLQS